MKNKFFLLLAGLLPAPFLAQAQAERIVADPFLNNGPRFFICLVAGVLLAIGFQALLTTLSVASGISAVGNIRKKVNKSSSHNNAGKNRQDDSDNTSVMEKISSAFGIWTLITVSVSLFFASFLAVKLSLVGANFIGLTLGLVIWAAFFTSMLYLEVKSVTSMVGSLISAVMSGLRSSASVAGNMAGSVFGKSSESEAKSVAKVSATENARAMRKELTKLFDRNDLDQKINDYVNRLSPQDLDVNRIKKELKDLITDIEVKEKAELGKDGITHRMFFDTVSKTPNVSKEDVKRLSGVFSEIKGIAKSDADPVEKAEMATEKFTPASQHDIDSFKKQVAEYLRGTDKRELQPEKIRKDIQAMIRNPKTAKSIFQSKTSAVDHDTIVDILSQRSDVSREDAEKYAEYAEKALIYLKDHLGSGSGGNGRNRGTADYDENGYRDADIRITRTGPDDGKGMNARRKLEQYLHTLNEKKDFDLKQIKNEFFSIFRSSGDDHESLMHKLKYYNKEEMRNYLANNTAIPADKADKIASVAVESRDTVLEKAYETEREVKMRLEQAKQEALQQAENTRKAAASAAWWLVATAVVSGAASALGGMLALESLFF